MKEEQIVVSSLDQRYKTLEPAIRKTTQHVLSILKKQKHSVEIYLVNSRFMKKNVLAFEVPEEFPTLDTQYIGLGEIYLNPTYIKQHDEDLIYMLVHGILHLLGYDHKKRDARMKMERKEKQLVNLVTK